MKEKYLTGKKEIFFLIINLIFFKSFANGPKAILRECGSSAFLSGAAAALICLAGAAVLGALYEKADCRNIFELSKKYISPLFSSALQIIIILYLALSLSLKKQLILHLLPHLKPRLSLSSPCFLPPPPFFRLKEAWKP